MTERLAKMAWVLDEYHMPVFCIGYHCGPVNPDHWWFPTIGWSVHDSRIYESKADAIVAASKALHREQESIAERINKLQGETP